MTALRSLPWATHAMMSIAFPLILVTPPVAQLGVGPVALEGSPIVDLGILLFACLVTAPLALIEVDQARHGCRVEARFFAFLAHAALAFFGMLPVTLTLALSGFSTDPITMDSVVSAVMTYALMLTIYLLGLVVCVQVATTRFDRHSREE